jgi:predicted dehydrogenase
MKFLIIGLGSMGKRRIRNLQALGEKDIIGMEPIEERRQQVEKEYEIKTISSAKDGFGQNPDAVIISTPPDKHGEYALMAAEHGKHFFVEASVLLEEEIIKANEIAKQKKIVAMPSCTMRFNWRMRKIKELVENNSIGKIIAINYHLGQWLPDWHPWEDIRKFYVGKRETGAGREMVPFELEWMQWIFGPVGKISCITGKFSGLPVDINDVYSLNLVIGGGIVANILIDVVSRYAVRRMEVTGERGSIVMNWDDNDVKLYDADKKEWKKFSEEEKQEQKGYWVKDDMYIDEMRHFLNAVSGKEELIYSMDDDIRNLNILLSAERSSHEGKHVHAADL